MPETPAIMVGTGTKAADAAIDLVVEFSAMVVNARVTDITVTKVRNHAIMMNFASCVVRADAANSRAYLLAGPGRSGEMRALAALQPQFGPCFPAGGNLTLNKSVLSAKLAEALYREAMAARTNMPEAPR